MIETSSDLSQKSSFIFVYLRKISEMFGKVCLAFGNVLENARKFSTSISTRAHVLFSIYAIKKEKMIMTSSMSLSSN